MSKQFSHDKITDHRSEIHSMPHNKPKRIRHKLYAQTAEGKEIPCKFSLNLAMIIAAYLIFGHLEGNLSIKLLTLAMIIISHITIGEEKNEN